MARLLSAFAPPPVPAAGRLQLAAGLCLLAGLWLHGGLLDEQLFLVANAYLGPAAPGLWSALAVAGTGLAATLLVGLGGPSRARLLAGTVLAVLLGGLLVQVLKSAFGSARPLEALGEGVVYVIGLPLRWRSMPSGHAACAFALATLACRLARGGAALGWLAWPAAVAVALSRLAVGAHWLSDVLAGAGIGMLLGAWLADSACGRRWTGSLAAQMLGRVGSRLVASLLVLGAAGLWVAPRDHALAGWVYQLLPAASLLAAWSWWRLHAGHRLPRRGAKGQGAPGELSGLQAAP